MIKKLFIFPWIFLMSCSANAITETPKPRVGVGVLVIKDNKILLGKRKGAHGTGCYSPPGGHLEFKETVEACSIRELNEETGLIALSTKVGPWTQNIIDEKHYISLFIIVTEFEGELQLSEPHKCEGWDWHSLDALPTPLFLPLKSLVDSIGISKWEKLIK